MDSQTQAAVAALKAAGWDQAAGVVEAIMAPAAAPSVGTPAPSADTAARMAAAASTPAGQTALATAASGGSEGDLARYSKMTAAQLADLPSGEFERALQLLKLAP